jgi:hypothetical protein
LLPLSCTGRAGWLTLYVYLQNRAIRSAVAEQEFWKNASHIRKDLYDVDAISDFWNWMTPFANVVLGSNTAGGMFPDQPGFFYRYFRILGLMRLRQIRVQKVLTHFPNKCTFLTATELCSWPSPGQNSCEVPKKLEEYITDCYAPFTTKVMDSSPFGPINPSSGLAEWKWYSANEMNEGSYTGRSWTVYPGSGYNVTLPLNYNAALEKLHYLKTNNWIDLQTRAVFLDFIAYNANLKLITLIKVAIEFPASSGCRPHLLLRTSKIERLVSDEMSNTALLAETILLVLVRLVFSKSRPRASLLQNVLTYSEPLQPLYSARSAKIPAPAIKILRRFLGLFRDGQLPALYCGLYHALPAVLCCLQVRLSAAA